MIITFKQKAQIFNPEEFHVFFRNEKWTPDTSWPKSRAESGEMLTVLYRSVPESGVGGQEGNVCNGDGVGAGTELVRPHPAVHPAQHLYSTLHYSTVQYSTVQHLAQLVRLVLAGLVSSEHDGVHHVPHSLHMT